MKLKIFIVLLVASVSLNGSVSSDGTQILYSINMPGNPFQQPYYQMMIKADNKNKVYSFSAKYKPQLYTVNACVNESECSSGIDDQTNVTSDYVSLYADGKERLSIIYGLSPYTFRGYVEGAASTLYMQRPAQVQLPFNPLAQIQTQNGAAPTYINATLPDYSDIFLAQTSGNIYQSIKCTSANCTFQNNATQMPSWYTYVPRVNHVTRGVSVILYGTIADLSKPKQPQTSFSPYTEAFGWGCIIAMGVTKMRATGLMVPQVLSDGVFAQTSWVRSQPSFMGYSSMQFMPIISPGYADDALYYPNLCNGCINNPDPLKTVLATGDLIGNYSVLNTNNSYIAAGIPITAYDGTPLNNGMSYYQLFAQNMQWFSLQTPLQTPLPLLSPTTLQNVTPGKGIFSDVIQLAAMEAPAAVGKAPVFTGSIGANTGIEGPVMMTGAAPLTTGHPVNFKIPQAFLSELTVANFKIGRYLQIPLVSQMNGAWSGGLVQAAIEDPLQYYQGIVPWNSEISGLMMPYLPIYFSDPGRPVDQSGWNYCPATLFNDPVSSQMCYDTTTSPMTNFYAALNGTR